ncbi:MAG: mannose-1-phosphate guanylyltransferase/mannose-6-phosphate isomerase, partial [Gammaproteobacteria bacterium]|nr:mannose-1-phosphate guanylyltransferase/mannose-6-phosphate isomerase [Gammaproteobacteria bacterium]
MITLYPVILCGGSGTRLWPLSREQYPKQLLSLVGSDTLLQSTVKRLHGLESTLDGITVAEPVIVTNESHRFLVAEQLREIGVNQPHIILEPCAKNTAPALTLAALHVQETDDNSLMLVMPADHVIRNADALKEAVKTGVDAALKNGLVTFGIVPDHAETGYGYIKKSHGPDIVSEIEEFVEKPDLKTAEEYLKSGDYVWNSGMFLFTADTWLNAIKCFKEDICLAVERAYNSKSQDMDFIRIDAELFDKAPSDSIDYAVMEHVTSSAGSAFHGYVVSLDAGWSDIGSWDSLWEISEKSDAGNVIKGDVFL